MENLDYAKIPSLDKDTKQLRKIIPCYDALYTLYLEYDEKMRQVDLYGKTIEVNGHQFANTYKLAHELATKSGIDLIPMYVYEDFCYGVELKGISHPWIEISAKTIRDMDNDSMKFLLARQYFILQNRYGEIDAIAKKLLSTAENIPSIPLSDIVKDGFQLKYAGWARMVQYSADNYGYLMTKNLKGNVDTILTLILNNVELARNVNLSAYIAQSQKIDKMTDIVSMYSKMDEKIPYGPYRIKNLISFAALTQNTSEVHQK